MARSAAAPGVRCSVVWPLFYLAIALTSAATFALQLSLFRVLAVVFTTDFAALAMTIALLTLAAGGLLTRRLVREPAHLFNPLGLLSLASSVLALISLSILVSRGAGLGLLPQWLICLAAALPFLPPGLSLALAISALGARAGSVCCFVLLGAAGGCLAVVGLLHAVGGPNAVIAVCVIYSGAAAVFFSLTGRRRGRILSVGAGLFFTLFVMANSGSKMIELRYAKGGQLVENPYAKWNSFSRVTLDAAGQWIYVDGAPASPLATPAQLARAGAGGPWMAHPGARTLIVNPGGGVEIAQALASGSRDVTGVELNAIIGKKIMREKFADLTTRLYSRPSVHIFVEEGLSFIRKGGRPYDVIVVNGVNVSSSEAGEFRSRLAAGGVLEFNKVAQAPQMVSLVLALAAGGLFLLWPGGSGARAISPWFVVSGMGFAVVLSAVVGQFVMFLGHPTYGLTVALFTALILAAAGSYAVLDLRLALAGSAILVAVVAMAAGTVLSLSAGLPLGTRVVIAILIISPLSFALGIPFPAALRIFGEQPSRAWALHLAGAGAGLALAQVLGVRLGWTVTLLAGGGLYLVALVGASLSPQLRSTAVAAGGNRS